MSMLSKHWVMRGCLILLSLLLIVFMYAKKIHIKVVTETDILTNCKLLALKGFYDETRETVVGKQVFLPDRIKQNVTDTHAVKARMMSFINKGIAADDRTLVDILKNYYIELPSNEPYNLNNPDRLEYSNGQTPFIDSRLNYIEGGFYVECGALNGEKGSNTLFFEKVRKWNGLLIEADPTNYQSLKSKNRKAFTINACLSPRPVPAILKFNKAFNRGRAIHDPSVDHWLKAQRIKSNTIEIECFPFYSLMLALNRTVVDFFSLDVEGDELNVLKTIPFDKLTIKILAVEYIHETGGHGQLQQFMESKGYETLLKMQRDDGGVNDLIFRKKGLTH